MGDMNFPASPEIGEDFLGWSWDGDKWVLSDREPSTPVVTTADVKLTNPQRADFKNQEDANQYFYDSIQDGVGGDGGDVDLTNYYTKPESDGKFQVKGNYLINEEDPTVPAHVKAITTTDINNWNNPPTGGGGGAVLSVNGKTGHVNLSYSDVGAQPAGSYATTSYAYSKSESDGKYALKGSGGGGSDPDAVKLTGNQTIAGQKSFTDALYFTNMFVKGVAAAGVGIGGKARIEFAPGATTIYSGSNTLQVNDTIGTSITGGLTCDNGGITAASFNTSLIGSPSTSVMSYFGRSIHSVGQGGCGFYFGNGTAITPTGPSDVNLDGEISLGNPSYKWFRVWAATTYSSERTMQNDNEAVLSVNDLIDVMQDLRTATKDEKTVEGLRDSIGNCVGGIIEKLEAIQFAAEEKRQKAIEEEERKQAEEEQRRIQESKLRTELPKEQ